jgi:ubiquinone biosynthesis protein
MEVICIPRYRHLKRYRQIVRSVARHGFGHVLTQLGLTGYLPSVRRTAENKRVLLHLSRAQRLRLLLLDLGPTFVKLGQLLSTRPDLVPRDLIEELSRLQDDVPPFPFTEVATIIEQELGRPLTEIYADFSTEPLAAASIGQVHAARMPDGTEVVVKIRRPQIPAQMETDLEILLEAARFADRHTSWGKVYRASDVVLEMQRATREELDFCNEAENAAQIRENMLHRHDLIIPRIYTAQTSAAVLTMEKVNGIKLNQPDILIAAGHNCEEVARRLIDVMFEQIFVHGFFHADPHPGNLAVTGDGRLVFMDFGIVGKMQGKRRRQFTRLLIGMVNGNAHLLVSSLTEIGFVSRRVDRKALRHDVERLMEKYLDLPLSKINLGRAVREIFALAFEHQIRIPAEFTLLGKTIMTLEGVIEELAPELKLIELLKPYARRLARERLSLTAFREILNEQGSEAAAFFFSLPRRLDEIFEHTYAEGFPLQLNYPDLDKLFSHLDKQINRLSFSVILLSFSMIMAGLIIGSALVVSITGETLLWRLPIIEAGFVLAGIMAVWLLFAILRSGRL